MSTELYEQVYFIIVRAGSFMEVANPCLDRQMSQITYLLK